MKLLAFIFEQPSYLLFPAENTSERIPRLSGPLAQLSQLDYVVLRHDWVSLVPEM